MSKHCTYALALIAVSFFLSRFFSIAVAAEQEIVAAAVATTPKFPIQVEAAFAALPKEVRPVKTMVAHNGALYCVLPNGCEIIVMEKHSAPVATVQAWVRTGAIHEGIWMGAGLSHFCEHMLFKGTTKRPTGTLDQEIRGAGGDDNAYTDSDRTVYHITTQREGFDASFLALSDMLMDSTFPPEETVKEHAVVQKEIERARDNPDSVLWDEFSQTLYQAHPYRVPVLGYPDRFKTVTHAEVFAYYKQRYSPQLCTFIAVGDFDAAKVMPAMAKELGQWKRNSTAPVTITDEPDQVAPRRVDLTHPLCEVSKLMQGFPTVSVRESDLYALDVLASILGDGRASRLYHTLKDDLNLVSEISAFNYTPQYRGFFGVTASLEDKNVEAAQTAVMKVLDESKQKKPSVEELARAKRKVFTRHVFAQVTAEGLAGDLGSNWFTAGDLDFSETYNQHIQEVTDEDVVRVAKKYLVAQKSNLAIMHPSSKETPETKNVKTDKASDVAALKNKVLQDELAKLKTRPEVSNATLLEDRAVFEFTLKANGLRVVVKEDASLPLAYLSLAALGGTRWEPTELAGAGNLLAEALDRGTQKLSKLQLAEQVEGLGASLSSFSGQNSFGLNASGLKQDLPTLIELATDCLLHPKFPSEEIEKLRSETLQQIAEEDESLSSLNSKILKPLLYGNHPYSRQVLGTAESVGKVKVEDLQKLHLSWVHPENLAVSFAGDVTAIQALDLTLTHFGSLKSGDFRAPAVPQVPELTEGKKGSAEKADITGAILRLGFRGVGLKNPDREALDMLSALLSGLGGRLFLAFRENEGLSYAVSAHNEAQLDGGAFIFFVQTDAQSLDKSVHKMWVEIKRLRDERISEKELNSLRSYLAGTEAIEQQDQGALAQRLALAQLYDEHAQHVFLRKERLEKLTPEMIQKVAKKYLDLQHWSQAILRPASK